MRGKLLDDSRVLLSSDRGALVQCLGVSNSVDESKNPKVAALHPNETERLKALRSYGILDTAIEPSFDDITKIASYVCQTPMSIISLVDEGRQWFKSEIGLGVRQTPMDQSTSKRSLFRMQTQLKPMPL
jgi:hypothetical protein